MSYFLVSSSISDLPTEDLTNCLNELMTLTMFVEICAILDDYNMLQKVSRRLRQLDTPQQNHFVFDKLIDS